MKSKFKIISNKNKKKLFINEKYTNIIKTIDVRILFVK